MICRDRKLIFVHIPKTGGTSLEDMLWTGPRAEADLWGGFIAKGRNKYQTGGLQHLTVQQVREEVGEDMFEACFTFALVRHPIDRVISQFNYLNSRKDLCRLLGLQEKRTLSLYLERIQAVEHVQWAAQSDFILDAEGQIVPELFQLDDVASNFSILGQKVGLTQAKMLHKNKSMSVGEAESWNTVRRQDLTSVQLAAIREIYHQDFETLNYD